MMDAKLTREISARCSDSVILPLSWRHANKLEACMEHQYCPVKHEHTKLRIFSRPKEYLP